MERHAGLPITRLLVTLAVVAALVALSRLSLPGVLPDSWAHDLDLLPLPSQFLWAYLLVEAVAGLVPKLRGLRAETMGDSARLLRAAMALAIANAVLGGIALALYLEDLEAQQAGTILAPGVWFRLAVVASNVGAVALVAILALAASRHGLASGFALLGTVAWMIDHPLTPAIEQAAFARVLPELALSIAALAVAFLWLRRAPLRPGSERARRALPLPAVGILPLFFAGELALRSARHLPFDFLTNRLVAPMACALILGLVLSALLFRTATVARAYGLEPSELRRARLVGTGLSLGWLAALVLIQDFAARMQVELFAGLLGIVMAVAFLDDAIEEWRFRARYGALVEVHELRRLWLGGLVQAACAERDIPVLLRGASFRSLFQGLGPIFEVTVMVPETHAEEARALLRARLAAALGESDSVPDTVGPVVEPG